MRNNEEFKSLVYSKRDGLLNEELERKRKFNKRKQIFAVLSSVMAACIVFAVVLPNIPKWANMQEAPHDEEVGGKNESDHLAEAPSPVGPDAEGNDVAVPMETEVAEVPMETSPPEMPEEVPVATDPEQEVSVPETAAASTVIAPSEIHPEGDGRMEVKFTATLSTEPGGQISPGEGVVGRLDGSIGEEILFITDYKTLQTTFEGLCSEVSVLSVFGGDLFDEDRVVIVIERMGGDTGDNEVKYSYEKVEDGTLYLTREYTYNGDEDVLCVEVNCVDFVVVNKHGFDLSQIISVNVAE